LKFKPDPCLLSDRNRNFFFHREGKKRRMRSSRPRKEAPASRFTLKIAVFLRGIRRGRERLLLAIGKSSTFYSEPKDLQTTYYGKNKSRRSIHQMRRKIKDSLYRGHRGGKWRLRGCRAEKKRRKARGGEQVGVFKRRDIRTPSWQTQGRKGGEDKFSLLTPEGKKEENDSPNPWAPGGGEKGGQLLIILRGGRK